MFLKLITCAYLLHLFMSNVFPKQHMKLLINLSYYCIYVYSFLEMKIKNIYLQFINNNTKLLGFMKYISKKYDEDNIEIISDNQSIITSNKDNSYWYYDIPNYCKFIIYSDPEPQTSRKNKIIIHNTDGIKNNSFKYTLCKYMFISVDLYIQNDLKQINYDLNLFFNGNNYYIANNKIDKYVICFLLYSRYGVYQKPETCKYKLNIIDQSANMFHLCERDVLHLYEDKYEIMEVICNGDNPYKECVMNKDESESENSSNESYEKIKENKIQ
uniref:Uncharacterized protein n=1 Tax=viral metagenome TaxID=1070528 RepID=A0A6C0BUY1_9ZZZZ